MSGGWRGSPTQQMRVTPVHPSFVRVVQHVQVKGCVQIIYAGKKAQLTIGNIKPVGELPEGLSLIHI